MLARPGCTPDELLKHKDRLVNRIGGHRVALFLDYDGTLTPIVERPELATLSGEMRSALRKLAEQMTVAVVSGRDLADVRKMVGLDNLVYAGSHGFDIAGPGGLKMEQEDAREALPELDRAENELRERLEPIAGCLVERKRFAVAVHYRRVAEEHVPSIESVVDEAQQRHASLRKRGGKKIFELQPDVEWDKGRAILWLLAALDLDRSDVLPIYVGDDETDEDAFLALCERGLAIRVGNTATPTHAPYFLRDTGEVREFLEFLLAMVST